MSLNSILKNALYIEIDGVIFVTSSLYNLKTFLKDNFYDPDFINLLDSGNWKELDPTYTVSKGNNSSYKLMDLVLIRKNEILTDQLYEKGEENGW